MAEQKHAIVAAHWVTPNSGLIELSRNWDKNSLPEFVLEPDGDCLEGVERADPLTFAEMNGYFSEEDRIGFLLFEDNYPEMDWPETRLFVAGDFNGWDKARGDATWEMPSIQVFGRAARGMSIEACRVLSNEAVPFKFVTGEGHWLTPQMTATNVFWDANNNANYQIFPQASGRHIFQFRVNHPRAIARDYHIQLAGSPKESVPIQPGHFFHQLKTDLPLGAFPDNKKTLFRLFAPRASRVVLGYFRNRDESDIQELDLELVEETTWQTEVPDDLTGGYYYYRVYSECCNQSIHRDPEFRILDPYAKAALGPKGPGVIVRPLPPIPQEERFSPPEWQDLVMMEAHVRDIIAKAPGIPDDERLGFRGMTRFLQDKSNYFNQMGVNTVELQPIQENDALSPKDYHWGYMTANYFAPTSHYASSPEDGSQREEFREMVQSFHQNNLAVILDVVYNHVGEPPHLLFIDKQYFFDIGPAGELVNWSGCGNTLRADSAMARRLIIDSLCYLVETFDVDGFRFDLAELIGISTLAAIEKALKEIKPSIILVAEPWSFRGHIAHDLKRTGYAYWNDGFRDFLPKYLGGHGNVPGISYFMKGSLDHLTAWPAQSVNYVESHDDFCWIDRITTNADNHGEHPSQDDVSRTHLMIAILMASLGAPLISAGQDFLRSKFGHHNTYLRGDINALDYGRRKQFNRTSTYFSHWIQFRLSPQGKVFRLFQRPGPDYLRFFSSDESTALGILYNNDQSLSQQPQVFFAVNPHQHHVSLPLHDQTLEGWIQVADQDVFGMKDAIRHYYHPHPHRLELPALSCGLWLER